MTAPSGGQGGASPLPPGLLARMVLTWRAPRRVMRAQASLSEPALMVVLLAAMALFFAAQLPVHIRAAAIDPGIPVEMRIGGAFVAVMGLLPLLAYAVAALVAGLLRRWISGHASRIALFWTTLTISPLTLLAGLIEGYLGASPGLMVLQIFILAAFLWFWFAGITAFWGRA